MVPRSRISSGYHADHTECNGATYPSTFHNGNKIHPLVGTDLMPAIKGKVSSIHEYMYWEHQGNRAVRWKNWKAVWDQEGKVWELYDIGGKTAWRLVICQPFIRISLNSYRTNGPYGQLRQKF